MKPDEDNCWYNGRDDFCRETYPGQYEWCSADYHRCVQCTDDGHCPSEKPYCDWDMECEECLVSAHCPTGESCLMRNGHWVCRKKNCVDYIEEGDYDYCANNFRDTPICDTEQRRCVECIVPSDCEGARQTCIASICVDESEMDCAQQIEAGFLNYCEVTFPELPICHTRLKECVECQYDYDCPQIDETHTCEGTRCIPKEWECEGPEDCMSDRYKCVLHECILKDCSDYDNPDAFCDEKQTGWRCLDKTCVRCIDDEDCREGQRCANNKCVNKTCDEDDFPDAWCRDRFGELYKCIDNECVEETVPPQNCSDFVSTADADEYCASLDPAKPHCDFDTDRCDECVYDQHCPAFMHCWGSICVECLEDFHCDGGHPPHGTYRCTGAPDWKCVKKICTDEVDPNGYCRDKYGAGYKCEEGICVLDTCDGIDARCPEGYYCPERECIWGCRDERNCPDAKPHCSAEGSCVECFGAPHCDYGYDCIDYICVKKEDCLHQDSLCQENEYCNVDYCVEGCRDSGNCSRTTPHCSQSTGKCEECVSDPHCEEGYECENYKCVWVGYDCSYDPECPKNWYCSNHSCVFGCNNSDENCADDTPHCSQATGKCEECWSDEHCEGGNYQKCEEYRCVAREGEEECKEGDVMHGKRCRDGIWVDIECRGDEECKGHEYCDDGLCRDKEGICEEPSDCSVGYYCNLSGNKCEKQECSAHDDCPVGQGCDINTFGWQERDNAQTKCISWSEYYCSDDDPCPEGWICDAGSGKCGEPLCYEGRPCQDGRYKCVDFHCIPKTCNDWEDPQGHCMEEKGWYGRCVEGVCTVLSCDFYPDPDLMCRETEGENWRCVEKRCMDFGGGGGGDPNQYCSDKLGIDEAYWDFESGKCAVPDCNTVNDPDKLCVQLKDPRYKCREGECRRGREGEKCENLEECVTGLRCISNTCTEKECIRWQDCEGEGMWCNHGICEPMRSECRSQSDCRNDYHCDAGGQCVPNDCDDHYDCGEGECCSDSKKCVRCEEITCWYNFHCRHGWSCNPSTNRCQKSGCTVDSECEEGYYCDLDDGICRKIEENVECRDNSDCSEGQVCRGVAGTIWVSGWPLGHIEGSEPGICVEEGTVVIKIKGIDDERTCDYCRSMMGKVIKEGQQLPPYHEHCRCGGEYVD